MFGYASQFYSAQVCILPKTRANITLMFFHLHQDQNNFQLLLNEKCFAEAKGGWIILKIILLQDSSLVLERLILFLMIISEATSLVANVRLVLLKWSMVGALLTILGPIEGGPMTHAPPPGFASAVHND